MIKMNGPNYVGVYNIGRDPIFEEMPNLHPLIFLQRTHLTTLLKADTSDAAASTSASSAETSSNSFTLNNA